MSTESSQIVDMVSRLIEEPTYQDVEVRVGNRTAVYRIIELTQAEAEHVLDKDRPGSVTARLVAAAVRRADGSRVTVEEASRMRASLVRQLVSHIVRVNGLDDESGKG